ncbi:hypothetical protein CBL_20287, partial [Carabus blaptoides fortunei]
MEERNHEGCTEPLMHTDVRWLSRGKFLQRFHDLIDEIKQFLITRGDNYKILEDNSVLEVLAILWAPSCGIRHPPDFQEKVHAILQTRDNPDAVQTTYNKIYE